MDKLEGTLEALREFPSGMRIVSDSLCAKDLAGMSTLAGLPAGEVDFLCSIGEVGEIDEGAAIFENNQPAEYLFFLLQGTVQFQIESEGTIVYAGAMSGGEVGGLLPYSRMTHYTGRAVALENSRGFRIHKSHFPAMSNHAPTLVQRLVGMMSDRVREATRMQQQREKMMALGKLSAGLAHELNNPAAAIRSATKALLDRLAVMPERVIRVGRHDLGEEHLKTLSSIPQILAAEQRPALKALERSRREDEITDWLEDHKIGSAYTMAETFVEAGFETECLDDIASQTPEDALDDVLCWVEGHTAIFNLVREVSSAAERISGLVESVKSYSHMDRSTSRQFTDIHDGLEATLTILGHKLKRKNIEVVRRYSTDAPAILGLPGELNQVWTNLIDNAIDAMPGEGGRLEIETRRTNFGVLVCITDNGSGIPEELQTRIFEPFFTTKAIGEGTGLGLDIAHRIIHRQHQGYIDVDSRPGNTVFQISLPSGAGPEPELPAPE
ncbi:MAG: ATP-binding protein [Bryobacterales bacterium]|nr:ATP-binding protein [Bryobacterales bacterium]